MNSADMFISSLTPDEAFDIGNYYYYNYKDEYEKYLSFKHYQTAAFKKHTMAMNYLGISYMDGFGVTANSKRGFNWFLKAYKLGNISACINLYNCYMKGIGVNKDIKKAYECLIFLEIKDEPFAYCELGKSYIYGTHGYNDIKKGIAYLTKGANKDDKDSILLLASIYQDNKYIEENSELVVYYYNKAISLNYKYAYNLLGLYYLEKNEYEKAQESFKEAYLNNDPSGYHNIGYMYEHGFYFEKDDKKAFEHYLKASEMSLDVSNLRLFSLYNNGIGIKKNKKKAIEYLKKAAEQNNKDALFILGLCNINGNGVKKEESKGFDYIKRASDLKNPEALLFMADKYYNEEDYENAFKYYKECADLYNDSISEYVIAYMWYENLYRIDDNIAFDYLNKSCNQNNSDAYYLYGYMYEYGIKLEINIDKAIYYYKKASIYGNIDALIAIISLIGDKDLNSYREELLNSEFNLYQINLKKTENGDSYALYLLGVLTENGFYTEKDYDKAIYYYEQAASKNIIFAIKRLVKIFEEKDDYSKANHYLNLGISLDDSECLFKLSLYNLKEGKIEEALNLLNKLVEKKYVDAIKKIGDLYEDGECVDKDIVKAISYFEIGDKLNSVLCQDELGFIYSNIEECMDLEKAKYYLKRAISNNSLRSMHNLGLIYYKEKKYKKSLKYFIEASKSINNAMCQLGIMYLYGRGLKKDYNKALFYFNKALEKGYDVPTKYFDIIKNKKSIFEIFK